MYNIIQNIVAYGITPLLCIAGSIITYFIFKKTGRREE